ncbi:hypothetical protein [Sphaerisporangium flaviroseum]|uniref:hypothetical protein n=1 Tax=Sphaerisporangium flaviroseum TaxID=509199 RepID=UPI0031E9660D
MAEFDELFASALCGLERVTSTRLRLVLAGGAQVEETARGLAARESDCCSFFVFTFAGDGKSLVLDVEVPAVQAKVLDGLAAQAVKAAPRVAP